jgi:hypothetical protein
MKPLKPAPTRAEVSTVAGVPFGSPGCKWPVGGSGADMLICGAERDGTKPYCVEHVERAYPGGGAKART